MSAAQPVALAVDLGGTKTALGIVSNAGQVLYRTEIPTQAQLGGTALAEITADTVQELATLAGKRGFAVQGVGIGSAGVIGAAGEVITAANLIKDWSGVPLAQIVAQSTGLITRAVNDVHAHALGEAWLGAASHASTSLMVAFGTGVGGAMVIDGKPMQGANFLAGHVGHFSSPLAAGLECACGGREHVEAIASGPSIYQLFLRLGGTTEAKDTRDVAYLALRENPHALEAIRTAGTAAGVALGDLANILDPHLIVLSGGVVNLGNQWWDALVHAFDRAALGHAKRTPITLATLGADAPLVGAASLILKD